MLENINLLNGMNDKMAFLMQRQRVLAQNITNSDTPGYRPNDVVEPDFAKALGRSKNGTGVQLSLATTEGSHIPHLQAVGAPQELSTAQQRRTYEVSPVGNAVDLEEQMMMSSRNNLDYQLITNLYNKNLEQLRTAMRRSGS
ncbi:MAG TPA: flagellar basal body rod protein FlgB [Alphaproteobacteria bacterium]